MRLIGAAGLALSVAILGAAVTDAAQAPAAEGEFARRLDAARAAYTERRFLDSHRELSAALSMTRAGRERQAKAVAAMPPPALPRSGIDVPHPTRTRNVPFRFPIQALRAGATGFVAVETVIDERGRVKTAKVVRSVRHLDQAALSAVRDWEFAPTLRDGKPTEVLAVFLANFTARTSPQVLDELQFAAYYHANEEYLAAEAALMRALPIVQGDVAACGDALPVGGPSSVIREPAKLKDVRPTYPEIMKDLMREARVTLNAVIDRQGAVTCVHVQQGDPFFDQSAVDAVKQWLFTPTLLDGKPVEVLMTVTVKYSVR